MRAISVVIPAYNEEDNIAETLHSIPVVGLKEAGLEVELLVVDNGSTDDTAAVARDCGARVIVQPVRGYGNAYKAGFANCTGDVIATGDADLTYPFQILPYAVEVLRRDGIEFMSTDRLTTLDPQSMTRSHIWGNRAFSLVTRTLFGAPFRDSQSGMWIFRRDVLSKVQVRSGGMAFSQELKVEAFRQGLRCAEMSIDYYPRGGESKNRTVVDGFGNLGQLLAARVRTGVSPAATANRPRRSGLVPVVDVRPVPEGAAP